MTSLPLGFTRKEYEALLLKAAQQIHLLGCWHEMQSEPCAHPAAEIWEAEAMQADTAFQVLFDHFGLQVPPEDLSHGRAEEQVPDEDDECDCDRMPDGRHECELMP